MRQLKYISLASFLFIGLISNPVYAYNCDNWVAKLQSTQGSVQVRQTVGDSTVKKWLKVNRNDTFCKGDILRVQENSRAALLLRNDTLIRLNQNTTITFTNLSPDKPSVVSVKTGLIHFISRVKAAFEVITPFINAAIEGTEFVVAVNKDNAEVTVFEGTVRAYNKFGEVRITDNQTAQAKQGQAPVLILKAKPRDAVNWSLYYPLITDPTASPSTKQASLKLSIGQVEQATKHLKQALTLNPNDSSALAMQAIISIVQNNKEQGLKQAQQAVAADENNSAAQLALSYAYQAHFNIDKALSTLQAAVQKINSNNSSSALIWSRLSEVYLMHSELDEALTAAKKANALNPNIGRTHTVLGFAYLTRIDIKQAITAFNNAIEKDQTDPLARLGLGLATIRQGNLEDGRREIEYAATLDPNNALIRSYLGKAYYEEKRNKLAAVQFKMAKALDPNDPTAYFYDAIRMQSENKNVLALKEMQQAIEKNDNKAVYSSNLKLEQDNAAKSVSQAQIYNAVGFEIEAQNLAYQSLQTDHSNHMAHRFLAESYATRPRHEIARVSEALQALLYSPLSHNPVPPHISETNLGTLPNAGPSTSSFNTYNSLFERNGSTWDLTFVGGDQQTAGNEIVYSILANNIAMSVGQYHFQTGGFRPNNDFKQDIVNFFFQSALSPSHSIQFEVKRNEADEGDLRLRFDPTNYNENSHETNEIDSFRFGHNWKISSHSNWVNSLSIISRDFTKTDHSLLAAGAGPGGADVILEDDLIEHHSAHIFETQYLYKADWLSSIFGLGNYDLEVGKNEIFQLTADGAVLTGGPSKIAETQTHANAYWYNYIPFNSHNTLIIGISNDDYDSNIVPKSENQTNQKLGLSYRINNNTLFRLASFKTLTRSLTTKQTIEPTQIAGFNQFYEDPLATKASNSGIGLDYFNTSLAMGIESLKRELKIPVNSNSSLIQAEQKENLYKAYTHFVHSNSMTIGIEWFYEEFDKVVTTKTPANQPSNLKTHRYPLFVAGDFGAFSTKVTMTYFDQDVTTPDASQNLTTVHDSFWVGDLQLSYKFAKRKGEIKLTVSNLFDQSFNYYDSTFRTVSAKAPTVSHDRSYSISANLPF